MTNQPVTPNDIAYAVAQTVNGFPTEGIQDALVLYPNPDAGGNPAIVITARDGSRYGLEVCPIQEPYELPNSPTGEPK
ncbi:hypothetical protein ACIPWE_40335 [Streptomyces sp. NPDC090073]|uniref:hypothetical protein n=1 Tax=Streptomyces sp. NPDC090073 TaxID=3365936 RepID=UPI0037FF53C2